MVRPITDAKRMARYIVIGEISGVMQVLISHAQIAYVFDTFTDAAVAAYHTGGRIVRVG